MATWSRVLTTSDLENITNTDFSSADLTLGDDRTHALDDNTLTFVGGGTQAKFILDGVNLTISDSDASPARIDLVPTTASGAPATSFISRQDGDTTFGFKLPSYPQEVSVDNQLCLFNLPDDETVGNMKIAAIENLPDVSNLAGDLPRDILSAASSGDFYFIANDTNEDKHVRVDFNDIVGALVLDLVNANIDAGFGNTTTYTNDTTGVIGDFNGDGVVSTADLLEFLTLFGAPPTFPSYNPRTVYLDTGQNTSLLALSGTSTADYSSIIAGGNFGRIDITTSGSVVSADGTLDVTIDTGSDTVTFADPVLGNYNMSGAPNKKIIIREIDDSQAAFAFTTQLADERVFVFVKVRAFSSGGTQIGEDFYHNIADVQTSEPAIIPVPLSQTLFVIGGGGGGVTSNNSTLGTVIPNGLANTSIDSLEVSFYAASLMGSASFVQIQDVQVKLEES